MPKRISRLLLQDRNWLPVLLGLVALAGLYATSRYNFLLFHCLAEAFSIVIGTAVFAIFWNTRHLFRHGLYLVVGLGCLFAGLLDVIYIFAYPGMSVIPGADGNIALQAKTVAQWYVSLSCVLAFRFVRRKIRVNLALTVYSVLLALALLLIFYWRVFPDCYVAGVGFTPFARLGLATSCLTYFVALLLLVRHRREFDGYVFGLLAGTLGAFLVQDAVSAVAVEMNGLARTIAHLCQVVALYFVYKAFIDVGLRKPYDLLFRRQQQSAEALERHRQFLEQRALQLRALASELALTEQRERRRLARALHDQLQQMLVAAKMQVNVAKRKVSDEGTSRSLRLIAELLDQSIAESRSLTVELSPPVLFDRGLVGGLEWLARQFLEKHHLPVSLEVDSGVDVHDEGTRIFLFQAARELLFNTVKHAQAQSARICLNRLEGDRVRLVVEDDGQGFDPSIMGGTNVSGGFGLFSIRERLELTGGRLEVSSARGQGTQMVIEVPGGRPVREMAAVPASDEPLRPVRGDACSLRIRVLLADDHAIVRQGLAGLLHGHPEIELVGEAKDGPQAVELALAKRPDVILMDITMPGLSGIEATHRIKAALPGVCIIGLSMHEDKDVASAMREAGAAAYLNKGEAADTLIATILEQAARHGRPVRP